MRIPKHAIAWILLLLAFAPASQAAEQTAKVTYLTSRTIYVDAGREQGLAVGQVITVLRDGAVLGEAVVKEVSSTRSACNWIGGEEMPAMGDAVRFEIAESSPSVSPQNEALSWWRARGLRGRIGVQSLHLRDRSDFGRNLDRPSLDLRLRGRNVANRGFDLEADVRARHSTIGDASRTRARTYRLNVSGGDSKSGVSWAAGRQYAPGLSVIHLFDGARIQYARDGWAFGALAGSQPDPEDLGLSGKIVEGGVWVTRFVQTSSARWSLTSAAIASYAEGTVDREFVYAQGQWSTARLMIRAEQEFDLNRGWKTEEAGESSFTATSTNLLARWRVHPLWSLDTGWDNRRRVRRVRDRETPVTDFDDTYRRGLWFGTSGRLPGGFDLGARVQTRGGEDIESADSVTLNAGYRSRWPIAWRLSSRSTLYRNQLLEGQLHSGHLSVHASGVLELGLFGGVRTETGRQNDLMDGSDPWFGFEADYLVRQNLWMSASWERTFDGEEAFEQLWLGSGLRF